MVELDDEGQRVGGDELGDGLGGGQLLGQVVPSLIELLEEHNGLISLDLVLGEEGLGGGDGELLVIHDSSDVLVGLGGSTLNILRNMIVWLIKHNANSPEHRNY